MFKKDMRLILTVSSLVYICMRVFVQASSEESSFSGSAGSSRQPDFADPPSTCWHNELFSR